MPKDGARIACRPVAEKASKNKTDTFSAFSMEKASKN
jgi:hypothetical protein